MNKKFELPFFCDFRNKLSIKFVKRRQTRHDDECGLSGFQSPLLDQKKGKSLQLMSKTSEFPVNTCFGNPISFENAKTFIILFSESEIQLFLALQKGKLISKTSNGNSEV